MITAIDPGTHQSAIVQWDGEKIVRKMLVTNRDALLFCDVMPDQGRVAIEMIAAYGMPVGRDVFETCVLIGRMEQILAGRGIEATRVLRREVKMHLCASARAKDSNIRQALVDRLGAPGTKKNQGCTYGIKKDLWAALALAVTCYDKPELLSGPTLHFPPSA